MKLGVLVKDLGATQLNYYLIRNANAWLAGHTCDDIIGFYADQVMPCIPLDFSVMQATEAWGFDGAVVATDLATAGKLLRFPGATDRLFYVWDLEWLRRGRHNYRDLAYVYRNPALKLLARNDDHKKVIEDCWNRQVHAVVDDFNLEQLSACL